MANFDRSWSAGHGPIRDNYNISDNPQFRLDVQNAKSGAVWILLTRHITEIEDFKDNREYITVMVYKNNGKKVFYPSITFFYSLYVISNFKKIK